MRPIEVILSAANLLAFLSLVIPTPPTLHWIRYAAPLALLTVLVQIVGEGTRWQMFPAYGLALIFGLIWFAGSVLHAAPQLSRVIMAGGIVLGGLGTIIAIGLPLALPVFHFPRPSGPYAIGTLTYHWVDDSRPEHFTADPNDRRAIMAQVWYPARAMPDTPRAPYLPDAERVTPIMARVTKLPSFLFSHFKYVTTNAVESAPFAATGRFPVLIFLSGLNGFRQVNTFQIEALVSQGYIVVGLDQPGAVAMVSLPDGRQITGLFRDEIQPLIEQSVEPQSPAPTLLGTPLPEGIIPYFAADVPFALDQLAALDQADPQDILTGRLDLERAGVFGVSLGGINAAEACLNDARLKACLIMDVFMSANVVREGLRQPALWITRDAETMRLERERSGGWTEKDIAQHQTTMRAVYERLDGAGYYVQVPLMFHLNLTDFPYWSPLWGAIGMIGPLDYQRVFDIINAYSVAFFDKHLKGIDVPLLDGPSTAYPEVQFETRQP
jgi:hypothetical protein